MAVRNNGLSMISFIISSAAASGMPLGSKRPCSLKPTKLVGGDNARRCRRRDVTR